MATYFSLAQRRIITNTSLVSSWTRNGHHWISWAIRAASQLLWGYQCSALSLSELHESALGQGMKLSWLLAAEIAPDSHTFPSEYLETGGDIMLAGRERVTRACRLCGTVERRRTNECLCVSV